MSHVALSWQHLAACFMTASKRRAKWSPEPWCSGHPTVRHDVTTAPFRRGGLKPHPHQQQCRSNRQHCRSYVRLCRLSKQHSTLLPQTATMSNEYRKISFFRQSRMLLRHRCRFLQQCCRFRQQCRTKFRPFDKVEKMNMFNLFRLCRKDEI